MPNNDISVKKDTFRRLISLGRVHDAVRMLRMMSEQKMAWEITDEINRVESSYRYLLRYAEEGIDDPSRGDVYASIVDDLLMTYDRLARHIGIRTPEATAYNAALRRCSSIEVSNAIKDASDAAASAGDAFGAAIGGGDPRGSMLEAEEKSRMMFDRIWTAFPLSADDSAAISALITSETDPMWLRQMALSAVMLGNNQYFDTRRVGILASVYGNQTDPSLAMTALTGLVITLGVHASRPLHPRLKARLDALRDTPGWHSDVKTVWLELIRTRDTERITRKIKDEVVPGMMKLKPEVDKALGDNGTADPEFADLEENPQWQELLESSGLADRLRELSELQEEGADVMMGTFAHLKSFPFFNSVANWFLPFHTGHSCVAALGDDARRIASLVGMAPMICDGDKYSFILAVGQVDKDRRDPMLAQLKAHTSDSIDLSSEAIGGSDATAREIVSRYVRNLYRFYKLYRNRTGLTDPLASIPDISSIPLFRPEEGDCDAVRLAAEFYFKYGYYSEALPLFRHVESVVGLDCQLFQKIGYSLQQLGMNEEALEYYEKSELLDASSAWTLRRIASCRRALGDLEGALEALKRLDGMEPDNVAVVRQIGSILLKLRRYDEAVKIFYRTDWLEGGDSPRSQRPLAWSLLMSGSPAKAEPIMEKLSSSADAAADDFLNLGHLRLSQGRLGDASEAYSRYIRSAGNPTLLINSVRADTDSLIELGIPRDVISLAIDAAIYRAEQE